MSQEGIPTNFGAQRSAGYSRFIGIARACALSTVAGSIVLLAADKFFPEGYRPSQVIGGFIGNVEVSEIRSKRDYATAFAAGMAEAQAQAQARGNMETEINREQQEVQKQAMQGQVAGANLADLSCFGAAISRAFGAPETAHALSQTCGMGDAIRQDMAEQQARIGREGGSLESRNGYGQSTVPTAPVQTAEADQRAKDHIGYQLDHQKEWEEKIGPEKVKEIGDGVGPIGIFGLVEYLNRLEAAATSAP